MTSRTTIALSFAAVLVSASAAMAATTHPTHRVSTHRENAAAEARADYAQQFRGRNQAGPYYYDADDNGSVWSFYPGYVPMAHN